MAAGPDFAAQARRQAHEILSQPSYTHTQHAPPRPLAGVLHAIGRALMVVFGPIVRWIRRELVDSVGHGFHAAFGSFAPVVGMVVALVAGIVVATLLIRRRTRASVLRPSMEGRAAARDPSELEQEADRRAAGGDFDAAVRLRFQAGLRRLEFEGLVANGAATTGRELVTGIGSPTLEGLVRQHEAIAYAALHAVAEDDDRARRQWPAVAGEARAHRHLVEAGRR